MRVAPSASLYGLLMQVGISIVPTKVAGPVSVTRPGSGTWSATLASPPSMCTVSSALRAIDEAPVGGRPRRRGGAGAARLGDAGAALVDAHRDGVALGPGVDDLEVDVGHLATEGEEVDAGDVVDGRPRCAGCRGRGGRRGGRGWCRWPPTRRARRARRPRPCRRWRGSCSGSSVGRTSTRRGPASVRIVCSPRSPRRRAMAWAKQRMPLPLISARLPSALYSTMRAA